MKVVLDICAECGKIFERTSNNHKYCSKHCVYHSRIEYLRNWVGKNPILMLLRGAKWRAKKKNLEFSIIPEDIIIPTECPILGIPLKINQTGRPGFFNDSYSLDRINPSKGYTKDNIRVISNRANLLKSNASVEELEKVLLDARRIGS